MAKKPPNIHVVPDGNGGWTNKPEGRPSVGRYPTQGAAIDAARPWAQDLGSELLIHRRNGQIRDRDSYGNDPFPPRG